MAIRPTKQSLYSLAPQQNGISIGRKEMTADADILINFFICGAKDNIDIIG